MAKYHVNNKSEVKECSATKKPCPLIHFNDPHEAQKHAEKVMEMTFGSGVGVERPMIARRNKVSSQVAPLKGGSYYGAEIDSEQIRPHIQEWIDHVGKAKADHMIAQKAERDGEDTYHITALSPQDTRASKILFGKRLEDAPAPPQADFSILGIGRVKEQDNEAWFLVCKSKDIDAWRDEMGLKPHNLHITLGFMKKDIHNQPKDESSIVKTF